MLQITYISIKVRKESPFFLKQFSNICQGSLQKIDFQFIFSSCKKEMLSVSFDKLNFKNTFVL